MATGYAVGCVDNAERDSDHEGSIMEETEEADVVDERTYFLMPFLDESVEEEFLETFHHEQLPYDRLMTIGVLGCAATFLQASLLPDPRASPGVPAAVNITLLYAALYFAPLILCWSFLNGYTSWRGQLIGVYRVLLVHTITMMHYGVPTGGFLQRGLINALMRAFVIRSRLCLPAFHILFLQVPYGQAFLITQGIMLGSFWASNKLECEFLYRLPAFYHSGLQLRELWHEVTSAGASSKCMAWCLKGVRRHLAACEPLCAGALESLLGAIGKPTLEMYVFYRFLIMTVGGCLLPMIAMYLYQIRARRRFAAARGLPEGDTSLFAARSPDLVAQDLVIFFVALGSQVLSDPWPLLV